MVTKCALIGQCGTTCVKCALTGHCGTACVKCALIGQCGTACVKCLYHITYCTVLVGLISLVTLGK